MATTPSHGIQGGLLAYYALKFFGIALRAFFPAVWSKFTPFAKPFVVVCVVVAVIFGMLPDLIGIYGHSHAALRAREQGDAQWLSARDWSAPQGYYWRAHNSDLYERFKIVPFYWLHVWQDKFWHKEGGGWTDEGYVFEVVLDLLMIALILFEWRKLKKELQRK